MGTLATPQRDVPVGATDRCACAARHRAAPPAPGVPSRGRRHRCDDAPMTSDFTIEPRGPFSLAAAQDFAGGFAAGIGGGSATGTPSSWRSPSKAGATARSSSCARTTDGGVVTGRVGETSDPKAPSARPPGPCRSTTTGAAGRRSGSATRSSAASRRTYRLAPARLLLLGVRGGRPRSSSASASPAARPPGSRRRWASASATRSTLDGVTHRRVPAAGAAARGARRSRACRPRRSAGCTAWPRPRSKAGSTRSGCARCRRTKPWPSSRRSTASGSFTAEATLLRGCGVVDELPRRSDDSRRPSAPSTGCPSPLDAASWHRITEGGGRTGCGRRSCSGSGWSEPSPAQSYRR